MSGSFVLRSGVGTQMLMVSRSLTTAKSVVASSLPAVAQSLDVGGRHVGDVRAALLDRRHLAPVEVDAGRVEPGLREFDGEWQSDVSQSDHSGSCAAGLDLLEKGSGDC